MTTCILVSILSLSPVFQAFSSLEPCLSMRMSQARKCSNVLLLSHYDSAVAATAGFAHAAEPLRLYLHRTDSIRPSAVPGSADQRPITNFKSMHLAVLVTGCEPVTGLVCYANAQGCIKQSYDDMHVMLAHLLYHGTPHAKSPATFDDTIPAGDFHQICEYQSADIVLCTGVPWWGGCIRSIGSCIPLPVVTTASTRTNEHACSASKKWALQHLCEH